MPMPGWAPVIAAWFTAACFLLLTFKLVWISAACGVVAIAAMVHWGWELDPPAGQPAVDIGGGLRLPVYMTGSQSQAWWAMCVLMLVSASLYGCLVFSYLYLWTVAPGTWTSQAPAAGYTLAAMGLLVASSGVVGWANRGVQRNGNCRALWLALPLLAAAWTVSFLAQHDVRAAESGYGAIVHAFLSVDGFFVAVAIFLGAYALARHAAGKVDAARRVTFDNARLFWHYTVVQSLAGLMVVHGFPRLLQ